MRFLVCVYILAGLSWTATLAGAEAQDAPPASSGTVTAEPAKPPAGGSSGTATQKAPAPTSGAASGLAPTSKGALSDRAAPAPTAAPSGSARSPGDSPSGSAAGSAVSPGGSPSGSAAGSAVSPGGSPSGSAAASTTGVAQGVVSTPTAGANPATGRAAADASSAAVGGEPAGAAGSGEAAGAASSGQVPTPGAASVAAAKRKGPPVAPSHDAERPVAPPVDEPSETGFSARLSLGVGGALWFTGGDSKLSRPFSFGLDLGYAITRKVTVIARGSSWFPNDNLANEFLGAGVVYRFVPERLYVVGALGISLTRVGPGSDWSHYVQGLALEADVGQWFTLTTHTAFSLGAHFQIGTPLLGKKPDAFTSLQAGIFVALGLR